MIWYSIKFYVQKNRIYRMSIKFNCRQIILNKTFRNCFKRRKIIISFCVLTFWGFDNYKLVNLALNTTLLFKINLCLQRGLRNILLNFIHKIFNWTWLNWHNSFLRARVRVSINDTIQLMGAHEQVQQLAM